MRFPQADAVDTRPSGGTIFSESDRREQTGHCGRRMFNKELLMDPPDSEEGWQRAGNSSEVLEP